MTCEHTNFHSNSSLGSLLDIATTPNWFVIFLLPACIALVVCDMIKEHWLLEIFVSLIKLVEFAHYNIITV